MPPIPALPFSIEFVSPRTMRIRMTSGPQVHPPQPELMLAGPVPHDDSWKYEKVPGGYRYTSHFGSVTIQENPFHIEIRDASGKLLTKTDHAEDNKTSFTPVLPFAFVRRAADYSRSMNAAFTLSPGEKIFGCGESFTGLDKRGQKIVLWTDDANGVENQGMYKPIPFFMSNRGYGMFMHTSTPITCDFGKTFSGVNSLMIGDDELDLFVFLGSPKDILDEYTKLTGKSPLPPLWSFGLWMSRCTYDSEKQVATSPRSCAKIKFPATCCTWTPAGLRPTGSATTNFPPRALPTPTKNAGGFEDERLSRFLLATALFRAEEQIVPRTRGAKPGRARRQGQSALRGRGAGFFQSQNGGLVSGQTRRPVENGRRRDQGGFWRSRAGKRHLRRRPHRILRT